MLYDHIDFRVGNVAMVRSLYDALFEAMGYTERHVESDSIGYHRPNESGSDAFFWIVEEYDHQPNGTRIAFATQSRAELDRLAAIVREHGACEYEAPQLVTEYGPAYYAAFFEDAEGNKLEICCRRLPAEERKPSDAFGMDRGKLWIAPDFDEPLEEFKEYT